MIDSNERAVTVKVERVYIICCSADVWFTRICVASVRYWHPCVPITLVRDDVRRPFDTSEIEETWNTTSRPVESRYAGWGLSKLDVLLNAPERRFMYLDSDIAFVGPVLDAVEACPGDVVASTYPAEEDGDFKSNYFDLAALLHHDPDFQFPGYVFNGGHIVAGAGVFRHQDFERFLSWTPKVRFKYPGLMNGAEQGIVNYVTALKVAAGQIRLGSVPYMIWAQSPAAARVELQHIQKRDTPPALIHWAGIKGRLLSRNPRTDILRFFEDEYYRPLGLNGRIKRSYRTAVLHVHQARMDRRLREVKDADTGTRQASVAGPLSPAG